MELNCPVLVDDLFPWFDGYNPAIEMLLSIRPEYRCGLFNKESFIDVSRPLLASLREDDLVIFPFMGAAPLLQLLRRDHASKVSFLALPCSRHPAISLPFVADSSENFLRRYAHSWSWRRLAARIDALQFGRIVILDTNVATGRTVAVIEAIIRSLVKDKHVPFRCICVFDERQALNPTACPGPRAMTKVRSPDQCAVVLYDHNVTYLSHLLHRHAFGAQELEDRLRELYTRIGDCTGFWQDPQVRYASTHNYPDDEFSANARWLSRIRYQDDSTLAYAATCDVPRDAIELHCNEAFFQLAASALP